MVIKINWKYVTGLQDIVAENLKMERGEKKRKELESVCKELEIKSQELKIITQASL